MLMGILSPGPRRSRASPHSRPHKSTYRPRAIHVYTDSPPTLDSIAIQVLQILNVSQAQVKVSGCRGVERLCCRIVGLSVSGEGIIKGVGS